MRRRHSESFAWMHIKVEPRLVTYLPGAGSFATRQRTMKGLFAPLLLSILLTPYAVSHVSDAPLPDAAVPGPRALI